MLWCSNTIPIIVCIVHLFSSLLSSRRLPSDIEELKWCLKDLQLNKFFFFFILNKHLHPKYMNFNIFYLDI